MPIRHAQSSIQTLITCLLHKQTPATSHLQHTQTLPASKITLQAWDDIANGFKQAGSGCQLQVSQL